MMICPQSTFLIIDSNSFLNLVGTCLMEASLVHHSARLLDMIRERTHTVRGYSVLTKLSGLNLGRLARRRPSHY